MRAACAAVPSAGSEGSSAGAARMATSLPTACCRESACPRPDPVGAVVSLIVEATGGVDVSAAPTLRPVTPASGNGIGDEPRGADAIAWGPAVVVGGDAPIAAGSPAAIPVMPGRGCGTPSALSCVTAKGAATSRVMTATGNNVRVDDVPFTEVPITLGTAASTLSLAVLASAEDARVAVGVAWIDA